MNNTCQEFRKKKFNSLKNDNVKKENSIFVPEKINAINWIVSSSAIKKDNFFLQKIKGKKIEQNLLKNNIFHDNFKRDSKDKKISSSQVSILRNDKS